MHKWAQEYQEQLEGYEMGSKNKSCKKTQAINYTPQPRQTDKGGLGIILLGLVFLILMSALGLIDYSREDNPSTIDPGTQQAIEGMKAVQEELDENQARELDEYIKEYGLSNEDRDTDK